MNGRYITNRREAREYLEQLRYPERGKLVDNYARIKPKGRDIVLEMGGKDIVIYRPNGMIVVNTHGSYSAATIFRINRHTPDWFQLIQFPYEKDQWHVKTPSGVFLFNDGIMLDVGEKRLFHLERKENINEL